MKRGNSFPGAQGRHGTAIVLSEVQLQILLERAPRSLRAMEEGQEEEEENFRALLNCR